MSSKFNALPALFLSALLALGCSQRTPLGDEPAEPGATSPLAKLSAPLNLSQFEVVSSGAGYRGIFLKLSRFPDSISASDSSDPAQIVLDIAGPTGVASPEESFPGGDTLVSLVHVSREVGNLRIVFDLATDDPPKYTVHQMGDWIMLRIAAPK